MPVNYGSLPFLEAIAFFRNKLNLPTQRWDDLLGAAHDRAFVVAGAMQADLLADLREAVDKAIAEGTTIETFRKDFKQIVAARGWTGWTGQGTKAGEAWRTRVIYDTNLFTSYSAGRFQQMKEVANIRPYWRYRHSPASTDPRPEHVAWDGLILKHDDPWWSSHTPPNGFGCKCYIETLADRDMKKQGLTVADKSKIPFPNSGVDKGWDYQPGASVAADLARLERMKEDKLKRLGGILPATKTPIEAAVSNAYEVAKAGGKHAGYLKQYASLPDHLVEKAARGFEKQIAMHNSWIDNPFLKLPPDCPAIEVDRLVAKKWPSDIARLEEQRDIVLGIIKERKQ